MYVCPVCGYNGLQYPPANFTICPSCYTEFGYDDATLTHEALRREWIQNGMQWEASNITPPPPGWNPVQQLLDAGFGYDVHPHGQPRISIVDLGLRQITEFAVITYNNSFRVGLKTRAVALGHAMQSLSNQIHPASASA